MTLSVSTYDAWVLHGPDEDKDVCPMCGASFSDQCRIEDDDDGDCPLEAFAEPDPDHLRDLRDDR